MLLSQCVTWYVQKLNCLLIILLTLVLLLEYHIQSNPRGFIWTKVSAFSEQVSSKCPRKACEYSFISEQYYTFPTLTEMVAERGWKYDSRSVWTYISIVCFHQSGNTTRLSGHSESESVQWERIDFRLSWKTQMDPPWNQLVHLWPLESLQ